jgi:MoxR-like ATPase
LLTLLCHRNCLLAGQLDLAKTHAVKSLARHLEVELQRA